MVVNEKIEYRDTLVFNITMSRYSRVKEEDKTPWKFNEINVLLRKVKEDATMTELVRIHRRHPDMIKAKLNTLAADYYFTNTDLFKQIQNITGVMEKDFLVHRDSIQSNLSMDSQSTTAAMISTGSSKATTSSVAVNTDVDSTAVLDDRINLGLCQGLAVSILDKIIGGSTVLRSTIQVLSTPVIKV